MAQYIDKDALVVEIDRILDYAEEHWDSDCVKAVWRFVHKLQNAINTLEVKEVDSLTPEEIKKICTIYNNLNQERKCATVLYNSDETFFNHVLMEYKSIA